MAKTLSRAARLRRLPLSLHCHRFLLRSPLRRGTLSLWLVLCERVAPYPRARRSSPPRRHGRVLWMAVSAFNARSLCERCDLICFSSLDDVQCFLLELTLRWRNGCRRSSHQSKPELATPLFSKALSVAL